ncbi:MAG: sugar transferase [Planctomycetota bacterium]
MSYTSQVEPLPHPKTVFCTADCHVANWFHSNPGRFQRVLRYERLRSDRSRLAFSLIVLSFDEDEPLWAGPPVIRTVMDRIRSTDRAGVLPDGRLGIIAPYTPEANARVLAEDLVARLSSEKHPPAVEIHEYTPTAKSETPEAGLIERWTTECGSAWDGNGRDGNARNLLDPIESATARPTPKWKRILDVMGSVTGLLLLSPLFLIVSVAIKCTSKGPIIFPQLRTGVEGRPFWIYKFRTMVDHAEEQKQFLLQFNEQDGPAFKIKCDPRTTRVGHFLRRTTIDELPQLWNVLRGDMSLVGPRPLPCDELDACAGWQRRRLSVKPGLTCTWQVQRNRNDIHFDDWMRMDLHYIERMSPGMDFAVLLLTLRAVLLNPIIDH